MAGGSGPLGSWLDLVQAVRGSAWQSAAGEASPLPGLSGRFGSRHRAGGEACRCVARPASPVGAWPLVACASRGVAGTAWRGEARLSRRC